MQFVRCAWPRRWPPAVAAPRSGAGIARRHGAYPRTH
uniref:Uncharacterized protein n=1 Tax=Arundo donax TaxID=35708 RepID=A0A0A9FWP7_ARUDO